MQEMLVVGQSVRTCVEADSLMPEPCWRDWPTLAGPCAGREAGGSLVDRCMWRNRGAASGDGLTVSECRWVA